MPRWAGAAAAAPSVKPTLRGPEWREEEGHPYMMSTHLISIVSNSYLPFYVLRETLYSPSSVNIIYIWPKKGLSSIVAWRERKKEKAKGQIQLSGRKLFAGGDPERVSGRRREEKKANTAYNQHISDITTSYFNRDCRLFLALPLISWLKTADQWPNILQGSFGWNG